MSSSDDEPESPDEAELSEPVDSPDEVELPEPVDSPELADPVASEPTASTVAVTYSVMTSVAVLVERIVVVTMVLELPEPRV